MQSLTYVFPDSEFLPQVLVSHLGGQVHPNNPRRHALEDIFNVRWIQ